MLVLVTGGSGFLGSYIAEELVKAGHHVRALVRKSSNRQFLETLRNIEFAEGSIEDRASVFRAVEGVDAIIHSAGLIKAKTPEEFRLINVEGTRNLLDAAIEKVPNLKRFVFISSLTAIGPSLDGTPLSVDATPNPVTHYGRSKLEAERLVLSRKDKLPVVSIRPPLVYGPRDNETFAFFQSVSRGVLPFFGDGQNTLSMIYGADAARACVKALTADIPSGRAYFIDDGNVYVWKDALEQLESVLGKRALLRIGLPLKVVSAAAIASEIYGKLSKKAVMLTRDKINELKQPHWVCDSSATRSDLDWTPEVMWREGVGNAATWYRAQGWL